MPKYNYLNAQGQRTELDLEVDVYRAAAESEMSLSQYVNTTYPTSHAEASTFDQLCASSGLFMKADDSIGISPPTMKQVLQGIGGAKVMAGSIVRPDGAGSNTPSGRLLFPEVILQTILSDLTISNDDFLSALDQMVAVTANVNTTKVDQPIINVTAPEAIESMPIGQLAEPAAMVTITVSEKTHRIPTRAVGLTISDQALESSTLDLVGLAMTGQARGERIRRAEADLKNMIDGDTDTGNGTGVTAVASTVYDSALAAGDLSQKAWIKWLRANYRQMTPDWLICGVDEALVIENRTNKPTNFTDDPNSTRMDALFTVENLGIRAPRVLLVDTSGANPVIGANDIIGLDSSQAIRRVVNVSASYEAVESYVMRRATSFRVDYGSMMHRLFESAWQRMTF